MRYIALAKVTSMHQRSMSFTFIRTFFVLFGITLLVSCVPEPPDSYTKESTVLRYQVSDFNLNFVELAVALGYLNNIELQVVGSVQGGVESIESLKKDDIDFATVPFIGLVAGEIATGAPIKAVAASYGISHDSSSALLVLKDSEIHEVHDLIGKTVGINTLGALGSAMVERHLFDAGLTEPEIVSVTQRALPGEYLEQRLYQGQVDAIWVTDSAKHQALEAGDFRILAEDSDLVQELNTGCMVVSQKLIDEHPAVVGELVDGIAQAIEFERSHSPEEVREVYFNYLEAHGQSDRISSFRYWEHSGVATRGGILTDREFSMWSHWIDRQYHVPDINPASIYTNQFNPYQKVNPSP